MANKVIAILALIIFAGGVVGAFFFGRASVDMPEISTNIERDTASYSKPLPDTVEKITTIYIKVPERATTPKDDVADSVSMDVVERDSSEVAVEIERKVYEDEKYKATISGPKIGEYSPVLESIDIYTQTETRVVQQPVKWIRPYVSALAGKDVLGIGGGVMIKERVSFGVKYMRFNNQDVVGGEMIFYSNNYHYVVLLSCIATADAQAQNDTNAPMEDLVFIYWGDCPSVAESPNTLPPAIGASATQDK